VTVLSQESKINLIHLTSHDYLFYASQDYGASARPIELIGNYAIMYGLNRNVPEIRRLISGNNPYYEEDLPKMGIYATPAAPASAAYFPTKSVGSRQIDYRPKVGSNHIKFDSEPRSTEITWNSTGTSLLWMMPTEKINIPKTGSYHKIVPLATFYFYTIGTPIPSIFRIGKKHTPARLDILPLTVKEEQGRFRPTCPVNVVDLPADTEILEGSLVTIPPAPLLLEAELDGRYVKGLDESGIVHQIPVPDQERFANSWSLEL
jgi:CRISPR type I-D-associated protein Csc1